MQLSSGVKRDLRERSMPLNGHNPNASSLSESVKRGLELAYEVASSIFQTNNRTGQSVDGGRCRNHQG
jgi:hypothetical protein